MCLHGQAINKRILPLNCGEECRWAARPGEELMASADPELGLYRAQKLCQGMWS